MNDAARRWAVKAIAKLSEEVRAKPGFIDDLDLKALYMILHSATSALMFNETFSLANTCANWCGEVADQTIENN